MIQPRVAAALTAAALALAGTQLAAVAPGIAATPQPASAAPAPRIADQRPIELPYQVIGSDYSQTWHSAANAALRVWPFRQTR